ncbi:MAG: phage portal protein [Actinomycetota bacterium]|nr:phage portal protein [Actinomycetota bacterium]
MLPAIREEARSTTYPLAFQDWVNYFSFNGNQYALQQTLGGDIQNMAPHFEGVMQGAYRDNGVVFACELARTSLFSEARFQFRQRQKGRPGDLFGSKDLALLETPWPGGTTGDLLTLMLLHADIGGSSFVARRRGALRVMRPDWITVVHGTNETTDGTEEPDELDAELIGYLYHPGGRYAGHKPVALLAEEVARFTPSVDPIHPYRGIPWVSSAIREIMGDKAATDHKLKFFENGATPNMVVKLDIADLTKFNEWVDKFEESHKGSVNAYKTLYMGAGAEATVVGTNLEQVDFRAVQGAGETRIAAAAGVPPIIAGFSEGLDSATYSNYGQARRRFADLTMRPLWRNVAGSLQQIIPTPAGAELWYDDRDIPFLAEDVKDAVESQGIQSRTIRTLLDAGFLPDTVVEAVAAGDWSRLEHSGKFSVQLQAPRAGTPPDDPAAVEVGRSLAALVAPYLKERTDDAA